MSYCKLVLPSIIGFIAVLSSCNLGFENNSPNPEISNLVVTPTVVHQLTDSVTITFDYYESTGDLGDTDPTINSLRVKDSRMESPQFYHIDPIIPVDLVPVYTTGQISIRVNDLFILGNDSIETLNFLVDVVDRDGNRSNLLVSDTITVQNP